MTGQLGDTAPLKRYKLPAVEVFEVTREQLEKIKEDQKQISLDSNITIATATACITLVAALVAGIDHSAVHAVFVVAALASVVASIICGVRWYHRASSVPSTVDRILARSIDPESRPSQDPPKRS